jgi:DNA-binding winged helix-turn-helix (wHTH) protein/tetratricopeptide (TPR) repeat protein
VKGDFTLEQSIVCVSLRTISRGGVSVRIEPKAMRVLEVLAQEAGKVVSKTSLIQAVWGHAHVTDDVLTRCVSCLRKALDDGAREQRIIQTVPKTGYRLIGAIQWIDADPGRAPIKSPTASEMPALHPNPVQINSGHVYPPRSNSWYVRQATSLVRGIGAITIATLAIIAAMHLFTAAAPLRKPLKDLTGPDISRPAVSEAHHYYLLGRYYWNKRTPAGLHRAETLFQQAVNVEPGYARAWAALADTYNVLPDWGVLPPREAFPRAKAAALEALQLDPSLAEAHAALGYAIGNYNWDWPQAEKEFQTALRLDSDYPSAHQWYAMQLAALGRFPEATAEIRKAQQLDPTSPVIGTDAADILYAAGRNAAAIDKFREVIDLNGDFPEAHAGLARVYERLGRIVLGQKRAALDWLETARDDHDSLVVFPTTTSDFDPVRGDTRFVQLLNTTGRAVSMQ